MSDYIVSARKYRPQSFKTVVGQKALVQTLKNAILSQKLAHAYLFCGPRGVGKTTCARIFAKTINCEHLTADGEACNECESCRAFNEQRSYNVYELDAASNNSVDNIRELIDQVQVPPQTGRYKVFIIDEVHMLSTQAFNAFLKTLEEPPHHAIFVMCTTEKQKILPTILSRCQTYDFQRITVQDIADQLAYIASEEHIETEPEALQFIARKADGGMRDALSVFDQIVSFTDGHVTRQATVDNLNILDYDIFFRLTDDALNGNIPAALLCLDGVIRRGFDAQTFIGGWSSHLRDLMVSQDAATAQLVEAAPSVVQQYKQQAAKCLPAFLYRALAITSECDFNYRNSRNKRLSVELAIVKVCQLLHPAQLPQQAQPAAVAPASNVRQPSAAAPQQRPVAAPAPHAAPQPAAPRPVGVAPQPQPQPRPMAQPAQSPIPQAAPQVQPRIMARGSASLGSMFGQRTQATPQQNEAAQQMQEMNEPVEPDALRRAWKEFIAANPAEKILISSMSEAVPELVEGTTYLSRVPGEIQMSEIEHNRERIVRFLREKLRNTHIVVNYELLPESERPHQAFSPREKIQEMIAENSAVEELVKAFSLEIA
ncbi:MAG: DNA polymerase III subunit gamma/tau [Bacteroidales bacterium]|jgi:DNA polymerase-3 subunit gamma/tau|nr:DNA polymerase III subunit gamma/tau [Bacteroidales bacterium]